ncbi:MAG: oligosaccharide flippase family protein [Patescibacteria group bacterium]|nr:oligosaccharide flippase family protein [Patescibacteria group bacterium]
MIKKIKKIIYNLLKKSEKWTKTDMIYLFKGGFWLSSGKIISSLSGLLLAIFFANLLPKEDYGTYKYILSIVGLLAIPTLSGINTALNRSIAQGNDKSFFISLKTKIKWGTLGGILSLLLAGYYYFYKDDTTLTICFLISSLFIPFMDPIMAYQSILIGKKKFKMLSTQNAIINTVAVLIIILVLATTRNLFAVLFSYFISHTTLRFIFLIFTLKKIKLNKNEDKSVISYGKHLSAMNIIGTISSQIDKILIFNYLGVVNLAIYSFAIVMPDQIRTFLKNINVLALPKMSQNLSLSKKDVIKKIKTFFIILLPIIILYIILAPTIYKLFFPEYLDSIIYSQLFSISLLGIPFSMLGLSYLTATKQQTKLYFLTTWLSIIKIILLIIGGYFFGLNGIIISIIFYQLSYSILIYNKM